MKLGPFLKPAAALAALAGLSVAGYLTRDRWVPLLVPPAARDDEPDEPVGPADVPTGKIVVNEQAQANLGLTAKPLVPQTYWKTILVPGMIVDRPGLSDRGVTAPVAGVVTSIAHVPGDTVRPGDPLFVIRVLSETLHVTQTDLFKAHQDIALARAQRKRLKDLAGAVPEARVIEVDNEIARLEVAVKAYRQELLSRGFTAEQIEGVTGGTFVREIALAVPARPAAAPAPRGGSEPEPPFAYEVQDLKVDLGQQVQAGQALCTLSNHQHLAVEGRAFRDETPLLERSVSAKWPVEVDFQEEPGSAWGRVQQEFRVRHLSNTIDPRTRTFAFLIPLENESRVIEDGGRTQTLWRFRPGQQVRLHVRVEELKDVFVLPADAVARDGPEAFVFTQNVNTFARRPVRVLLYERARAVVANDGSLPPGTFAVQSGAAQLNRMVKAGGASGAPKGYHIHADGSLHKNEDEGK